MVNKDVIFEGLTSQVGMILNTIPIFGGRNNQGYKLVTERGVYFLKLYSQLQITSLNKMETEFYFNEHLYKYGNQQVAKPIMHCKNNLFALFSYIDGVKITSCNEVHIRDSVAFISSINTQNLLSSFDNTIIASEAVSSLSCFKNLVKKRLKSLYKNENLDEEATQCNYIVNLVSKELIRIEEKYEYIDWNIEVKKTILSPSDFGFHNAFTTRERLVYFDFEYAGLDSEWKLLADYFCQQLIPVPLNYVCIFLDNPLFEDIKNHVSEFIVAYELTKLKWCLIMLNEFDYDSSQRRVFSSQLENNIDQINILKYKKKEQVKKSYLYFKSIESDLLVLKEKMNI